MGMNLCAETEREIEKHCWEFMALKGVGRQRGCDGCEAGEAECWEHYCETVLRKKFEAMQ
jgi:hypothetical protein